METAWHKKGTVVMKWSWLLTSIIATKVAAPITASRVLNIVKIEMNTVGEGVGTGVDIRLGAGVGIKVSVGMGVGKWVGCPYGAGVGIEVGLEGTGVGRAEGKAIIAKSSIATSPGFVVCVIKWRYCKIEAKRELEVGFRRKWIDRKGLLKVGRGMN